MLKSGLIINADDFGYDSNVNQAILESFSQGLCSSTTIMANMPGFEEACQLCRDNGLTGRVGLHLVLSDGVPLSDEIKRCSNFCNSEGHFHQMRRGHFFKLSTEEKHAVAKEISIQIDLCRKCGISLTHVDSHHHIHVQWGVAGVLLPIVKASRLRYVRLARSLDPDSTWLKNRYRNLFNFRIITRGFAATRYFGEVDDLVYLRAKSNLHNIAIGSFEITIHPAFDYNRVLIDAITRRSLDEYVRGINGYANAVSYGQI